MDHDKLARNFSPKNLTVKIDHIFVILITLSGFLVYAHQLFPELSVWKTSFFELTALAPYTVQTFFYVVGVKVTPLFLLSIWFVTDDHWWRWGMLFPIGNLVLQLAGLMHEALGWFLGTTLLELAPFIFLFFLLLILFRNLLKYSIHNFGSIHHIGAENLFMIPDSRQQYARIERVKQLMLSDHFDRERLHLIYKEYDYLKNLNNDLAVSHDLSLKRFEFLEEKFGLKRTLEVAVFLFLVTMPWILKFYDLAHEGVGRYDLFFFTLWDHGFHDVRTLLWVLSSKLVVVLPVTLWFFTSRFWWKYFLLIPFSIFLVQVFDLFSANGEIAGVEFFLVLPVILGVLGVMAVVSMRIRKYLSLMEFYGVMEKKINETVSSMASENTGEMQQHLRDELNNLMHGHKQLSPEAYLKALKDIKQRLEKLQKGV